MKYLTLVVSFILLLTTAKSFAADDNVVVGKVNAVYTGDIATVTTDKGLLYIRLAGIDTPDLQQAFGKESQDILAHMIAGKVVIARLIGMDPCGRSVAIVWIDGDNGLDISSRMVANGAAWVYYRYVKNEHLEKLQEQAKEQGIGLWALPADKREAPWEWRKQARFKGIVPSDACPIRQPEPDYSAGSTNNGIQSAEFDS